MLFGLFAAPRAGGFTVGGRLFGYASRAPGSARSSGHFQLQMGACILRMNMARRKGSLAITNITGRRYPKPQTLNPKPEVGCSSAPKTLRGFRLPGGVACKDAVSVHRPLLLAPRAKSSPGPEVFVFRGERALSRCCEALAHPGYPDLRLCLLLLGRCPGALCTLELFVGGFCGVAKVCFSASSRPGFLRGGRTQEGENCSLFQKCSKQGCPKGSYTEVLYPPSEPCA